MNLIVNPPATIDSHALITVTGTCPDLVTARLHPPAPQGTNPNVTTNGSSFTITFQGAVGTNYTSIDVFVPPNGKEIDDVPIAVANAPIESL
jgi:hypothetical protein